MPAAHAAPLRRGPRAATPSRRGRRPDDREVVDDAAQIGGERVEPGRDETVQRCGQRPETLRSQIVRAVGVAHERHELLDEERVAAAAFLEEGDHAVVDRFSVELTCQFGGGCAVERVEMQHGGVVVSGRWRPTLLEVGARRGEQQERVRAEPAQEAGQRRRAPDRRPSARRTSSGSAAVAARDASNIAIAARIASSRARPGSTPGLVTPWVM